MQRSFWSILAMALVWSLPVKAGNHFLPPEQAFRLAVTPEGGGRVRLSWNIEEGYYLYRERLKVEGVPSGSVRQVETPVGTPKTDAYFGESEVYHGSVDVVVEAPDARLLNVSWQGCAEAGLCYPPQYRQVKLPDPAATSSGAAGARPAAAVAGAFRADAVRAPPIAVDSLGEDQELAERLSRNSLAWMLAVFFGLGLLMAFTPCMLPMLPILSSLIVGSGATPRRGLVLSVAFVLPMALTYAALGAAAALAGANLQAILQNPWVLGAFGLVFVALALSMFGFYELQLPAAIRDRLDHASRTRRGGTLGGAAAMGVISALLVGPCMTAPLAGALLYIGKTGDVLTGGLALLSLGLGMGVPLLLVGTLGARLLPRPGDWMNRVKALFGFVLLGSAVVMVARVLPAVTTLALTGAWMLAIAFGLLALARKLGTGTGGLVSRYLALLIGLWSGAMLIGAAGGAQNPLQPLAFLAGGAASAREASPTDFMAGFASVKTPQELETRVAEAGRRGQWTLVDFSADWCVSCRVIEREVFGDPRVRQALADTRLLRADVTANDADDRAMMSAQGILGPPTLLLFGPDGEERRAERVVGELGADDFLARLARARQGG